MRPCRIFSTSFVHAPVRTVARQHTIVQQRSHLPVITAFFHSTKLKQQATPTPTQPPRRRQLVFDNRSPSFQDFLSKAASNDDKHLPEKATGGIAAEELPYFSGMKSNWGCGRRFYVEVYGCQMNVNDTEILNSILTSAGYEKTEEVDSADVIFLVTCAIREKAEAKIWDRLKELKATKRAKLSKSPPLVGVLGCMAERLKTSLLEDSRLVDIVCGPDAYRSIPHLLSVASSMSEDGVGVANVMLSADETYADIVPLRIDESKVGGWVSIMRGCNNMCSFCVVPFTRGIERSRPVESIISEVKYLRDQGIKEVTLLGQNVNSYRDTTTLSSFPPTPTNLSNPGFHTIYKQKNGGLRFTELLDQVSLIDPELRIRFTSPHPKDFPRPLLDLITSRPNICSSLHLPAQSGSSSVLSRMRRGYTREAYLELIAEVRRVIPGVWISTDMIAGFCGETENEWAETTQLMEEVGFNMAFMFAYSMRERTHAHRTMHDDVPAEIKSRRVKEMVDTFHRVAREKNKKIIGSWQLVLIEGEITKPRRWNERLKWAGRSDGGHKVFIEEGEVHEGLLKARDRRVPFGKGDYVAVKVTGATSASLEGLPVARSGLREFDEWVRKGGELIPLANTINHSVETLSSK